MGALRSARMMVRQEIEEGKEVEEGKGGRGGKDIAAGRLGRSSAAPVHESNAGREAAARVQKEKHAGHYDRALDQIAGLRKAIDRFFEEVMVMAENEAVRKNRLALLSELLREFTTIADFSEIAADEK